MNKDWDSGAARQDAYQQERMEEVSRGVGDQNSGPAF